MRFKAGTEESQTRAHLNCANTENVDANFTEIGEGRFGEGCIFR